MVRTILSQKIAITTPTRRRRWCCNAPKETGQAPVLRSFAANGDGSAAASPQGSAAIFSFAGSLIGARKSSTVASAKRRAASCKQSRRPSHDRPGRSRSWPRLKPGARLVREWHGRTHTVTVTEDGFEYAGASYSSLTKIAKKITGAHWSGPRFFGLVRGGQATERGQTMSKSARADASPHETLRCAIYTRKSTEEGLEQAFNSLDAQREACAAFILSQKHEGWAVLPTL